MRMIRRFGENILDDTFGQFTSALVLLQYDKHGHAWFNIYAGLSIHTLYSF